MSAPLAPRPLLCGERPIHRTLTGAGRVLSVQLGFALDTCAWRPAENLAIIQRAFVPEHELMDVGLPKRRAEWLLWAHAAAPDAQPFIDCTVRLARTSRTVRAWGAREWIPGPLGWRISAPEWVRAVPLSWSNTFGGPGFTANPLGNGLDAPQRLRAREPAVLPALELPGAPSRQPDQPGLPAGFGACAFLLPSANHPQGALPSSQLDIDPVAGNCQLASPEQRVSAWQGDERFELTGFHPQHPVLAATLPGVVLRCFVARKGDARLQELPCCADTVCLFPSALSASLIYRVSLDAVPGRPVETVLLSVESAQALRPAGYHDEVLAHGVTLQGKARLDFLDEALLPDTRACLPVDIDGPFPAFPRPQAALSAATAHRISLPAAAFTGLFATAAVAAAVSSASGSSGSKPAPATAPVTDTQATLKTAVQAETALGADSVRAATPAAAPAGPPESVSGPGVTPGADPLAQLPPHPAFAQHAPALQPLAARLHALAAGDGQSPSTAAAVISAIQALPASLPQLGDGVRNQMTTALGRVSDVIASTHSTALAGDGQGEALMSQLTAMADLLGQGMGLHTSESVPVPGSAPQTDAATVMSSDAMTAQLTQLGDALGLPASFAGTSGDSVPGGVGALVLQHAANTQAGAANRAAVVAQNSATWGQADPEALASVSAQLASGAKLDPTGLPPALQSFAQASAGLDSAALPANGLLGRLDEAMVHLPPEAQAQLQQAVQAFRADQAERAAIAAGRPRAPGGAPDAPSAPGQPADRVHAVDPVSPAQVPPGSDPMQSGAVPDAPDTHAANEPASPRAPEGPSGTHPRVPGLDAALPLALPAALGAGLAALTRSPVSPGNAGEPGNHSSDHNAPAAAPGTDGSSEAAAPLEHATDQLDAALLDARRRAPRALVIAPPDQTTRIERGRQLRAAVRAHESVDGRDFAYAQLDGAQLDGADLRGVLLEGADLGGASLRGACLAGAALQGATLEGARCEAADLTGANLQGVRAASVRLDAARLDDAHLQEGDFAGASLVRGSLTRVQAARSVWYQADLRHSTGEMPDLDEADLRGAQLSGARWQQPRFMGARLDHLDATGADLSGGRFVKVCGERVVLRGATLTEANFHLAQLPGLNGEHIHASGSHWLEANLEHAELSDADLTDVTLVKTNLTHAVLQRCRLLRAQCLEARAGSANLDGSQLFGANLVSVHAPGASFRHANLELALLDSARLTHADFTGANLRGTLAGAP